MAITRSMSKSMNSSSMSASTEAPAEILGTEAEQKSVLRKKVDLMFEGEIDMKGCRWDFMTWFRETYPARLFELEGTVVTWRMNPEVQEANRQKNIISLENYRKFEEICETIDSSLDSGKLFLGVNEDPTEIVKMLED